MVKTRITASKIKGKVVVMYDGEVIRRLEPKEAIECGGEIAKAATEHSKAAKQPSSDTDKSAYPDNKSAVTKTRSKKPDDGGDDWKGPNKNSLINGSL